MEAVERVSKERFYEIIHIAKSRPWTKSEKIEECTYLYQKYVDLANHIEEIIKHNEEQIARDTNMRNCFLKRANKFEIQLNKLKGESK